MAQKSKYSKERKGRILFIEQFNVEHSTNEAALVCAYLTHALRLKIDPEIVSAALDALSKISEVKGDLGGSKVFDRIANLLREKGSFDFHAAMKAVKKSYYLDDLNLDILPEFIHANQLMNFYKRGLKEGADSFTVVMTATECDHFVATRGKLTKRQMVAGVEKSFDE